MQNLEAVKNGPWECEFETNKKKSSLKVVMIRRSRADQRAGEKGVVRSQDAALL